MILYQNKNLRIIAKKQASGDFFLYKQVKKTFGDSFYSDFLTIVKGERILELKQELKRAGAI